MNTNLMNENEVELVAVKTGWSVRIEGQSFGVIRETGFNQFKAIPRVPGYKTYGVHPVFPTLEEATEYVVDFFEMLND